MSNDGNYSVGPGVQAAIDAADDDTRSDEIYLILTEGAKISRTFGRDGVYYYYEADNSTKRTPF